jgi:hypothetical protein
MQATLIVTSAFCQPEAAVVRFATTLRCNQPRRVGQAVPKQTGWPGDRSGVDRFFRVHGPFAQAEQMVQKGIYHRANQEASHHGRGNRDPGGEYAPEDGCGQREGPDAGFHGSNPSEWGPCGLNARILTVAAGAGKGAVQKCVRVGLRKMDRLIIRCRNELVSSKGHSSSSYRSHNPPSQASHTAYAHREHRDSNRNSTSGPRQTGHVRSGIETMRGAGDSNSRDGVDIVCSTRRTRKRCGTMYTDRTSDTMLVVHSTGRALRAGSPRVAEVVRLRRCVEPGSHDLGQ